MQNKNWELNYIQLEILKSLLFKKETRFSEIDRKDFGSNLIAYHLKQLINHEYVIKNQNGTYSLTSKGKEFGSMIDTWNSYAVIHKQGKLRSACVLFKGEVGKSDFVTSQRLKEPFFEYSGFPVEKVQFGETPEEAGYRCVKQETGLEVNLRLSGIVHKLMYQNSELIEDNYFFMYVSEHVKGNLLESGEGFRNSWINAKDFNNLEKVYEGTKKALELVIISTSIFFYEDKFNLLEF